LGALDDTALRSASIYTRDAGVTWVCEVDGAVVATHTTNVPTVSTELIPLVIIKAGGGYMAAPTGSPEFWYVEADLVALG
ncbi:MAG: hypothetical protein O2976_05720, partial [Actinomycetota bacterium]|nr:hypothetical protein [Actinomycetota bacterium]